jgi:hypothetical protein
MAVFDLISKTLHPWTKANLDKIPANFLSRYNRIQGIFQLSTNKYILFTNYTFTPLDLTAALPSESQIIQNQPKKEGIESDWFDRVKLASEPYLQQRETEEEKSEATDGNLNLSINNKLKGILYMGPAQMEQGKVTKIFGVETVWKQMVKKFPGTLLLKKYGKS